MSAQVLHGSKQEIAEKIVQMPGEIREVIVIVDEAGPLPARPTLCNPNETVEEMFARNGALHGSTSVTPDFSRRSNLHADGRRMILLTTRMFSGA